jgi:signal transduction histidine kinase
LSPTRGSILVRADAGRLEQVFVNLLANAIEHAATSTIDVTLRRSGSSAIVEVRDHGPGIASNVLPQLFQPYARLGQKPSTGLGLGLYLAREIVMAHGGSIDAASSLGEGTVIVVRLPVGNQKAHTDPGPGAHPTT